MLAFLERKGETKKKKKCPVCFSCQNSKVFLIVFKRGKTVALCPAQFMSSNQICTKKFNNFMKNKLSIPPNQRTTDLVFFFFPNKKKYINLNGKAVTVCDVCSYWRIACEKSMARFSFIIGESLQVIWHPKYDFFFYSSWFREAQKLSPECDADSNPIYLKQREKEKI